VDYGLAGKVAIVTGTASQIGIGRSVCLTLAKEGCDIVSADMNLEGAGQTATAVRSVGRRAIAVKVDVSQGSETDDMAKAAVKEFGKIDILVNAAGVAAGGPVPFLQSKQETWEKDMAVNVYGDHELLKGGNSLYG
jgi:NAD(P)-dependent dehydrogenase (short-subunit alcohol dehydrogenase family)